MIKLSKEAEEYITSTNFGAFKMNGIVYYFKNELKEKAGLELVLEEVAKRINLHCAHYDIVKLNDEYYYLSTDINTYGKFTQLSYYYTKDKKKNDVYIEDNADGNISLYNIWHVLEGNYKDDIESLMKDIVKTYILDILFSNPDRHMNNIGILEKDGKPTVYIFDNSYSFISDMNVVISSKYLEYYDSNINYNDNILNNVRDLKEFLSTSSEEYIDLCINILDKLTPEYVSKVFLDVAYYNTLNDFKKEEYIDAYRYNYELVKNMIVKREL